MIGLHVGGRLLGASMGSVSADAARQLERINGVFLALGRDFPIICIEFMSGYYLLVIEEEDPASSAQEINVHNQRRTEH